MNEVWVGLTEVSKADGCELEFHGVGAFVWWATQAESEERFLQKLRDALRYYKLVLLKVTGIRKFSEWDQVSGEFYEMVEQATQNEKGTIYGTFHTFPYHEA